MRFLFLLFGLLLCTCGRAQIGQNPPEVDWRKIDTEVGRVIFPAGYETRAKRVASLIELLEAKHQQSIGDQHYPFDLVLRTPDMTTNGYVGLAPFRSEFFVTPPQSLNSLSVTDWVDLLTIHEYRHVQQNSNERRGITRLASYLQGQYGWAVVSSIATPNWFSEGDAVIAETALSAGGRGRTPAFSQELRSLLADNITYSYDKARNGSLRSLVPDHYRYGYAMLTYARERYGNDFWRSVLHDGAAYRSLIYPFDRALKKKVGFGTRELYQRTMQELKARQDSAIAARPAIIAGEAIGYEFKPPTNYRFATTDDQGRLLALRSGFQLTPALVVVDPEGGKDQIITPVGIQREAYVDIRDNLATWMETRQNPRFTNQNYSDIIVYELASGRSRKLTNKGKFLSPSLSFDRRQIVAVEDDPLKGPPSVVIFDTQSGEEKWRLPVKTQAISYPRFAPDGQSVYYYDRNFQGIAIHQVSLEDKNVVTIKSRAAEPVDWLQVTTDGGLVYSSGRDGVDNIYQLDPVAKQVRQLTNVVIGATLPHLANDGNLYYSEATPQGLRLRRLSLVDKASTTLPGSMLPAGPSVFERPAAFAAETEDITSETEVKEYPVTEFSDNFGGVKLHSWSYNGSYVSPGLTVEAANALQTVLLSAGGQYNINEKRYSGAIQATYGGWYPLVSLRGQFRDRNYSTLNPARDTFVIAGQEFNQVSVGVAAAVPLSWVAGEFLTSINPGIGFTYFALSDPAEGTLPANFSGMSLSFNASSFRRRALAQVQSTLGFSLAIDYDFALGETLGSRLLVRSAAQFPGLHPTHGTRIELDFQREAAGNLYQYIDGFRYSRGYSAPVNDRVVRLGINYQLPLLYPDWGIAGISYFKRVRLNLFYDYSRYSIEQFQNFDFTERSVGGELLFDNVWLNTQELTVGVQMAYRLDPDFFSRDPNDLQFRLLFGGFF